MTSSLAPSQGPRIGFVPTYYPGAIGRDGARPVVVRGGQDTEGIDFGLIQGKLARITGTVTDSAHNTVTASRASITLSSSSRDSGSSSRGTSVRPDGSFTFQDVPPGTYWLVASVTYGDATQPNPNREGAMASVTVNGNDVAVNLQTNRGATISGHVVRTGPVQPPVTLPDGRVFTPPPEATRVMVAARPAPSGNIPSSGWASPATVAEDGTFTLTGLRGSVLFNVTSGVGLLQAIRRGGEDITTTPLLLTGAEHIDDLEVVLTTDLGRMMGSVVDGSGKPAPGAWVIVFPDDPKRWTIGSGSVQAARTLETAPPLPARMTPRPGGPAPIRRAPGDFIYPRLLPGRYFVFALAGEGGTGINLMQFDEEVLAKYSRQATAVTVTSGETAVVQLRIK
jgi:hypothetical protein